MGAAVGASVGLVVGLAVGCEVGALLTCSVGLADSAKVGLLEGRAVVGRGLGAGVGDNVGLMRRGSRREENYMRYKEQASNGCSNTNRQNIVESRTRRRKNQGSRHTNHQ